MNELQKQQLCERLKEQKIRNLQKEIICLKNQIQQEIPDFHQKYCFAEPEEIKILSEHIRFSDKKLPVADAPDWNPAFLCFLYGSEALFQIAVKGSLQNFLHDYEDWEVFSPCLLIMHENLHEAVYIDDSHRLWHV